MNFAAIRAKAEGAASKVKKTVVPYRESNVPTPPARGFGHLPQSSTSSIPEPPASPRRQNGNHAARTSVEDPDGTPSATMDALTRNKEQFFDFLDDVGSISNLSSINLHSFLSSSLAIVITNPQLMMGQPLIQSRELHRLDGR